MGVFLSAFVAFLVYNQEGKPTRNTPNCIYN
nr:MAG TPA: hypothetical protein [Caudoviricetes sp.]